MLSSQGAPGYQRIGGEVMKLGFRLSAIPRRLSRSRQTATSRPTHPAEDMSVARMVVLRRFGVSAFGEVSACRFLRGAIARIRIPGTAPPRRTAPCPVDQLEDLLERNVSAN
jgi:hypothetical protein